MLFPENARKIATVLTCGYLAGVAALTVLLDYAFALTYTWLFTGPVLLAGAIVGVTMIILFRSKTCAIALVAFLTFVLIVHNLDFTPVKPYKRMFASIAVGMSVSEVQQILQREFPKNGRFRVPVETSGPEFIQFILDPNDGAYNAELITIDLRNLVVARKLYLPD